MGAENAGLDLREHSLEQTARFPETVRKVSILKRGMNVGYNGTPASCAIKSLRFGFPKFSCASSKPAFWQHSRTVRLPYTGEAGNRREGRLHVDRKNYYSYGSINKTAFRPRLLCYFLQQHLNTSAVT